MMRHVLTSAVSRRLGRGAQRLSPSARSAINALRGIDQPRLVVLPPGSRVLCVAPHPDDELLGCGGTLAKHRAAGHDVHVVFVTSGEGSAGAHGTRQSAVEQRETEAARAMQVALPEATSQFLRLRDGCLTDQRVALELALDDVIAASGADLVYAPHPGERHGDHVAVSEALIRVLSARDAGPHVEHVAWYEVWSPLPATCIVDVTAEFSCKIKGLECYESQLQITGYARTAQGLAAYRSAQPLKGHGYAEAFVVMSRVELTRWAEQAPLT
ncbi:MAG TPA: PIG-L family deacetylase [Acidothermaceae bacterium]